MLRKTAQHIAESAGEATGHDVVITDENCIIIGCSMKKRAGNFYGPAERVIHGNRSSAAAADRAKKTDSSSEVTVTLPLRSAGETIGSVSVTGIREEAGRCALLLQKQLEIMLREQAALESALVRERALSRLAENIASYDGSRGMANTINIQAMELGVKLPACRSAALLVIKGLKGKGPAAAMRTAAAELPLVFPHRQIVICPQDSSSASVLIMRGRSVSDEDITKEITAAAKKMLNDLEKRGITADIAVGLPAKDLKGLSASLRSAKEAMRTARQMGLSGVFSAERLAAESLLGLIPAAGREEFANRTLGALLSRNDYCEMRDTFLGWCRAPFACKDVAEKLSLHRNSLQYRLKKIRSLTGKDPRSFKDAFELWAAFVLKDLNREENDIITARRRGYRTQKAEKVPG